MNESTLGACKSVRKRKFCQILIMHFTIIPNYNFQSFPRYWEDILCPWRMVSQRIVLAWTRRFMMLPNSSNHWQQTRVVLRARNAATCFRFFKSRRPKLGFWVDTIPFIFSNYMYPNVQPPWSFHLFGMQNVEPGRMAEGNDFIHFLCRAEQKKK